MKSKKLILILILVLTIGIVGLTIAYFANSSTITNTFNTNPYGTTVTEEFVSPDNWLPGTSTTKSLTVTNSGQIDEAVRISYTEVWTSRSAKNNNEEGDLPLQQNGNTAALIHFTNTDDWTTVTENGITYRYYNYKLAPSATTSELLDYVTFNSAITNSSNCTTTESNGTKTITCNSTGNGYDDATYKLTFTIETIQYDKYKTAWGTNVNIASMKPMNARELALKSNPVSITNYTDGNIHEMYTFNHEATEQTPALTDYRYIGDDPYNYVYFNCDSLDNQNSENCEVWRIIGVFDVERPDPNDNTQTITERRMKLVRGSALPETMAWDAGDWDKTGNNWSTSSLTEILNNKYFLKLDEDFNYQINNSSKVLVDDSKFYLGGVRSDTNVYEDTPPIYGNPEDMYFWERGLEVFNPINFSECFNQESDNGRCVKRSTYWIGKIALLYPSDFYYIFANKVDDICYGDPHFCNSNNYYEYIDPIAHGYGRKTRNAGKPTLNWIYRNSNISNNIWLLSASSNYPTSIFYVKNDGSLPFASCNSKFSILPTLYLSSSVKIIDGDGSINNPYKLSNS